MAHRGQQGQRGQHGQFAPHTQHVPRLPTATLSRSRAVQSLIQRAFAVTYSHLSKLQGRTIKQYCKDEENVPNYIVKFFTPKENEVIASTTSVDKYEVKLIHKLLKNCCGLKPHKDKSWGSEDDKDTFEFLITFCYTSYLNLHEDSAVKDYKLNFEMDKVLEALVLLIEKVEKEKKVDETSLKSELMKHIGEELESYDDDDDDDDDRPCTQFTYLILCEHVVHQMLVMVYIHLNHLNGMSLSRYLNYRRINLIPRTLFSNERKFLEGNPPPHKMPVSILYRVVKRVCFSFDVRRRYQPEGLESILHDLKKEFNTPPNDILIECHNDWVYQCNKYKDKSYKIYELLDRALEELCSKTGKDRRLVIGNLAQEPLVAEYIQLQHELPIPSTQCVSSPSQDSQSPEVSPPSPTIPETSTSLSQAVACTTPGASTLKVEEVNVCVLFRVMCPGGLISQTLALVFEALKGNLAIPKQDNKTWKNKFTTAEKEIITNYNDKSKNSEPLSKRDITFLCKVLRYGCSKLSANDDVWLTKSDSLEYQIHFIKKERNKLAHEVSSLKTEELKNILDTIENSLDTILDKTEGKLRDCEQNMKTELQEQRSKVKEEMQKSSQISHDIETKNYWREMEDMSNKVKIAAQQELKKPYLYSESLQCLSPISGSSDPRHKSLTIEEVFMERELEDKDGMKAEGTYRIEDILFCQNSALASFRVFIVHGRPGDGKTSICKYAFHLWSSNVKESSQKGVDLLFYISCRNVTTKSLSAYLKGKLPKTFAGTKTDDIIPLLQEPQVLFVIDGYDEAGEEAKGLIDEILTSFPDSKIIFTTKSQWCPKIIDKVKAVTSRYKVLSMVEMTEKERHQYVRKIFRTMGRGTEDCNEFLKYLNEMKENLKFLIHLPLTFSLLSLLWIEEPGKAKRIRTLAQLYYKLIDLILKRVTKQLGKNDLYYCREWMITLGELAWDNLKKNKHYLSEQDQTPLKRKAEELGLGVDGNNHIISNLLHCEIHDSLVDSEKSWTFMLTSQQEYFAAEYLVDALKKDKTASIGKILELSPHSEDEVKNYNKKLQRLLPVIEFVFGLLLIQDSVTEARVKELTEVMAVTEPWSFVAIEKMFKYLLQEKPQMERVLKKMFAGHKMRTFEGHDIQNALWVLMNTSLYVPEEVTLTYAVSDVLQIKPLLDYLVLEDCVITVVVDIDKETNIPCLAEFAGQDGYKDITFVLRPWKPLCISEAIMKWPYSRPLYLNFSHEVFALMWWEALMCLLTMKKRVEKIVCNGEDKKCFNLIKHATTKLLKAEIVADDSLEPTCIIIHGSSRDYEDSKC